MAVMLNCLMPEMSVERNRHLATLVGSESLRALRQVPTLFE